MKACDFFMSLPPDSTPPASDPSAAELSSSSGEERANGEFFVVGIGASAGGLDAISEVLRNLPEGCNLAVVVVQHLDPNHDSLLVELLSRVSTLPVHWAIGGDAI